MTDIFCTMPKSEVIVKAVPEYSEQTAAAGLLSSSSTWRSRPGVFYANSYIKQTPTYSMRTLIMKQHPAIIIRLHIPRERQSYHV